MATKNNRAARYQNNEEESLLDGGGPQYPTIMFRKGDPKMKRAGGLDYHGGFFISDESVPKGDDGDPVDMSQYGFEQDMFTTSDNKDIEGYSAQEITICLVNMRKGWAVRDVGVFPFKDGRKDALAAANGDNYPSGTAHILCYLKDAVELGPFILTLSGHAQMSFSSARPYDSTGIMKHFNDTVIEAARQEAPARYPFRAFWMTIAPSQDRKGAPVFYTVGPKGKTSKIVVPELSNRFAKWQDVTDLDEHFLDDELLDMVDELYEESAEWRAEWDTPQIKDDAKPKEDTPFDSNEDEEDLDGLV